jgi:hypothetical protein
MVRIFLEDSEVAGRRAVPGTSAADGRLVHDFSVEQEKRLLLREIDIKRDALIRRENLPRGGEGENGNAAALRELHRGG